MSHLVLPDVLRDPSNLEAAVKHLRDYCAPRGDGLGPVFTGSQFESLEKSASLPDQIGTADLLAVTMLGVNVPGEASLRILDTDSEEIHQLLSAIPTDVDFIDATEILHRGQAAWNLWTIIDSYDDVGPTITSKIMARKRPALIPVQDSVIRKALGYRQGMGDFWAHLRALLSGYDFKAAMRTIRDQAAVERQFSDLRVFDIVVWMDHRRKQSA